jgi:hypothetical protein
MFFISTKVQILTQRGPWLGAAEDVQYNFDDLPHGIRDHGILVLSLLALLVQKSTNTRILTTCLTALEITAFWYSVYLLY